MSKLGYVFQNEKRLNANKIVKTNGDIEIRTSSSVAKFGSNKHIWGVTVEQLDPPTLSSFVQI